MEQPENMMDCPAAETSAQPIIQIENLCTKFGDVVVHENVNLSINQGEIVSLVGGSGSGKTVLLRQMLGLNHPASGTVRIFGEDINRISQQELQKLRNRWGMLFQHGALFSALTVFDNVAQPMRELRVLPKQLIREAAMLKLQMAGIGPEHALKMPSDLSGGMIKRVALARALALEPELLFLDEPTAGLDPNASESFVDLIRTLRDEMRLTVVMVTHDLDTLFSLSSRVAVLADKHIIAYCKPENVVEFKHPFIETFFRGERGLRAIEAMPDTSEESRQEQKQRQHQDSAS
ncbi:phospholipid/cholesterol/gamma-HCH transport system ATP-binding protein [Herminiimonas fonticola]|uniref:Phospholipid/cholesterol/gamma-HCH transport system ATP-binding protein n=2 Tax=Herminiimonas fonticola TaxID=303380 RepID=A0A4R6GGW0_9BURK|nr:ABC-type transport system involved in resistance to organic solvents ATPase component [Herminiimonas fonticola]TDN94057.1 phospholipid/cholesterol/gamma-HCH transport system ATP-binding protein [Herminiimonas fonticola]